MMVYAEYVGCHKLDKVQSIDESLANFGQKYIIYVNNKVKTTQITLYIQRLFVPENVQH